jgi:hypothetical protein
LFASEAHGTGFAYTCTQKHTHLLHVGEEALEQGPLVRLVENDEGALKLSFGSVLKLLDVAAHNLER